nr:reverse transcriptase domain-containing protein [Tanacetum cinerariifolium]
MLVVEIDVGGMTADVVDKLTCSSNVVQPRQVDLRNLFQPLDNPELTIRRRSRSDLTLLNNSEMAAEGNGDLLVPDLRTMEELCQPSLNGRGGPIAPISIQATNFGLKNDMIQQVHNYFQFHGLPGDDANKYLYKFLHISKSIKVNLVIDDALRLYLFPHSLTHHSTAWFDRLPRNSINTFEQMDKMFLEKYFPPSMVTKLINEITNFPLKAEMAKISKNLMRVLQVNQQVKTVTPNYKTCGGPHSFSDCPATVGNTQNIYAAGAYQELKNMFGQFMKMNTASSSGSETLPGNIITNPKEDLKGITTRRGTAYPGPMIPSTSSSTVVERTTEAAKDMVHPTNNGRTEDVQPPVVPTESPILNSEPVISPIIEPIASPFMKMNIASSSGSETLPGNIITNLKEDLKGITTRRGTAYPGPMIPSTSSSPVVERTTEAAKDMVHPTNNGRTEDVQPPVVPTESPILNSEPVISPIIEPIASPVSASRPNHRPSIPYPSRLHDQKLRDKANDQREKFFQIFKDLNFNISFVDALILMPKFGPSIKSLLTNKDKLYELARTPLNENCSAVLLKKFPEKLGDPDKFLIPCDFLGMAECLALADLNARINLMPLSVWNKLSLPDLSPMYMTLELADRSISHPDGITEDVFVKVGTFHFSTDFIIVDFDADSRVPLILKRYFLKTGRALIDVFEGSIPLISESFQAMARLCDFRTIIREVFSSIPKSFAIMTGVHQLKIYQISLHGFLVPYELQAYNFLDWEGVMMDHHSRKLLGEECPPQYRHKTDQLSVKVSSPANTSIKSLPVLRKDLSRIRGLDIARITRKEPKTGQ